MRPMTTAPTARSSSRALSLGGAALAMWLAQTINHVRRNEAWENLWGCNLAALLIAAGCLVPAPTSLAIGISWLTVGTSYWLIYLASGAELIATSVLVHLVVLPMGVVATLRVGWPEGAWYKATVAMPILILLTRAVAPAWTNLNLSFAVWSGWEKWFPSHPSYLALVVAGNAVVFIAVDAAMRRWHRPGRERQGAT
jgi:hypothetical protein